MRLDCARRVADAWAGPNTRDLAAHGVALYRAGEPERALSPLRQATDYRGADGHDHEHVFLARLFLGLSHFDIGAEETARTMLAELEAERCRAEHRICHTWLGQARARMLR
jgi:hypothetical protein